MSTLNFLNVIIHLGGIRAKPQISGWRLAHADDAFLQQSVRAGGMQTYFNINRSKTSLGKLLLQKKKTAKRHDILWFSIWMFLFPCALLPSIHIDIGVLTAGVSIIKSQSTDAPGFLTASVYTEWADVPWKSRESWTSDVLLFHSHSWNSRGTQISLVPHHQHLVIPWSWETNPRSS